VNKLSLISESVTEVQINIQPCRGKFDQHDIRTPTDRPHMATFHNDIIGSVQVPPLPIACLPLDTTHWAIRGWPPYTVNISRGMVWYHLTTTTIKLRRLTRSHIASMRSLRTVLNRHRQGLPPWNVEYPQPSPRPSYPKILYFPPFPLPVSNLNHQPNLYKFQF
jgi:hypothetical protein